jgi:polyphosphate kinase
MTRNIDHRVEVLVPIREPAMIRHLRDDVLAVYLADDVKARQMNTTGVYTRRKSGAKSKTNAQEWFIRQRRQPPKKHGRDRARLKPPA